MTISAAFGSNRRNVMACAIAIHRRAARLDGVEFFEGVFLADQTGEFCERIFATT
jgi:hypothetical protein